MPSLLKLSLDRLLFQSLLESTHQYEGFSRAQAKARMVQGTAYETRDIFASLLESKTLRDEEALTDSELVSESSLLIIAGKRDDPQVTTIYRLTIFSPILQVQIIWLPP